MPSNQQAIAEETAKRVVRKATKLQPRQISQLLTPYLVNNINVGQTSKGWAKIYLKNIFNPV
jgi:hypothetical protein